ncbi:Adenylate and Guanylate cyclase catalytic domain containing protein [Tritrichomonas foetus]|uniref:Adenylate and Guanylate cyclase catalytic domain containing protein n=1 Tax=Tritrichomonas foetus TaxID=1144522 RepID=A0A1J4JVC2_9EUKA|nr:Adenylate and Guanylate cyclase catalytic domain containing protein [Tritrichomonas foetus]|eukprot:OHT01476.1 Adenylate and Guanylate cyclase catalytic domain containing protein [Tritrichomonas foetus]
MLALPADDGQTSLFTTNNVGLSSISTSAKYRGMIQESGYKKIRNSFFVLFDYISTTSPPFYSLHTVIGLWRILQIIGPSFAVQYPGFWGDGTTMKKVFDIISITFHLIPGFAREEAAIYVLYVYSTIFIICFIGISVAAFVLTKSSKLPVLVSNAFTIFFSTGGYLLHPVAMNLEGELIGRLIMQKEDFSVAKIIAIILAFETVVLYIWLYSNMYSVSITFKPDSLMAAIPITGTFTLVSNILITFITGFASQFNKIPCVLLTVVAMFLYGVSIFILFDKGGLVTFWHIKCNAASYLTGVLQLFVVIILELLEKAANEIVMVIFIVVWFLCYLLFSFYLGKRAIKSLFTLDELANESNYENIKSPRVLCNLIINGFRFSHEICISHAIFKKGVELWPKNVEIWYLYAKFNVIYPDNQQQMIFISMGILQNKLSGSLAKHMLQQIHSIMKQRESNLIPDLKMKLDKIGKQVQSTKHKIRYIWDLVLQGNLKELERVIGNAYRSIESCETEFNHFLRQFPNNRFVARAYCRFLRDVVADHAGNKVWLTNVAELQKGNTIKDDQTYLYGIHAFPNLPRETDIHLQQTQQNNIGITDDTFTQEIEIDDEHAALDAELRISVRDAIHNLTIPAYWWARAMRIITLLILFIIPVIFLALYIPIFIGDNAEPLDFIYDISLIRARLFQVVSNSYHYVCENLHLEFDMSTPIESPEIYNGIKVLPMLSSLNITDQGFEDPPNYFGNSYDSKVQTDYIIQRLTDLLPELSKLSSFKIGDESMDELRQLIFGEKISFTYFSNPTFLEGYDITTTNASSFIINRTSNKISAKNAISEYIVLFRQLTDETFIMEENVMLSKFMTTPVNNIRLVTNDLSEALNIVRNFIISHGRSTNRYVTIILVVIILFNVAVYVLCMILISYNVANNKELIFRCLTALPKNVVSHIADSFKILKKEEDDELQQSYTRNEDVNKQEENMLKIFSSSDSASGSSNDDMLWGICTLLIIVCHIIITVINCNLVTSTINHLMKSAPHIDFIMASYSYDLATVLLVCMLPAAFHPYISYHMQGFSIDRIISVIPEWQERATTTYQAVRFGDDSLDAVSFQSLGINIAYGSSNLDCDDDIPTTLHEIYGCFSSDLITAFTQMMVNSLYYKYNANKSHIYGGDDVYLAHLWHMNQVHIFNEYFAPMFSQIIPMVVDSLNRDVPMVTGFSFGILLIAVIIEIVFIYSINKSEERQKFALKLLLHCPGNIIVSNSHISSILGGNFKTRQVDSTTRNSEFYDKLVKDIPDSVIICNLDGKIMSINYATERIFELEDHEIVNTNIVEFGKRFKEENPFESYFGVNQKMNCDKEVSFVKPDGNLSKIELTINSISDAIIATSRDITQTFMYNQLITDERSKSDRLLASILPARLVHRVQAGEKNISFAVQSATIFFMDIVSFTPWCGSLPAATVMKTLNLLFKEIDALVNSRPQMTKIKCIGDCYMAAGGIFAEINQPSQHAKDVVCFGLDCIDTLEKLNKQINETLQIRIGVNTGGPIVAGVLGTKKPTFEILGPTINMAQQMEHHGVPMRVYISRAVYELIYGGNFDVKERGETEIKGGKVITYLVCRETSS